MNKFNNYKLAHKVDKYDNIQFQNRKKPHNDVNHQVNMDVCIYNLCIYQTYLPVFNYIIFISYSV